VDSSIWGTLPPAFVNARRRNIHRRGVTSDAQGLYAELGFVELDDAHRWMQRRSR
jgi:hypothetical protein